MVKHLQEQLTELQGAKEALATSRTREDALQQQVRSFCNNFNDCVTFWTHHCTTSDGSVISSIITSLVFVFSNPFLLILYVADPAAEGAEGS